MFCGIMEQQKITYEQPLNEYIRACLRLEYLFRKAENYLDAKSAWDAHHGVVAIIEILDVLDRPDIKNKLYNILRLHSARLIGLSEIPGVDQDKLREVMYELDQYIDLLHSIHGKIAQDLRENEFLNAVRQRLAVAGGTTDFAIPAYYLWLKHTPEQRKQDLHDWFTRFVSIKSIVALLLQLTRESAMPKPKTAEHGFFQENLLVDNEHQMVRVSLPLELDLYPEISVGRHRASIHFYKLDVDGRPTQATDDIPFELTYCKI